jgi:hypothetical protein
MAEFSDPKRDLLLAISSTRKQRRSIDASGEGSLNDRNDVIRLVAELEKSFEKSSGAVLSVESLNGAWSLVYSTRASATTTSSLSFFDAISGNLYKLFFKFAPFLAGSQGPDLGNKLGVRFEHIYPSYELSDSKLFSMRFILIYLGHKSADH